MSTTIRNPVSPRFILGLSLIFLGVIFFLDRLGELDADDVIDFWPAVLVLAGFGKLVWPGSRGGRLTGALLILIGGWFLAWNLYWIDYSPWDYWPILLVVVGLRLAWQGLFDSGERHKADDSSVVNSLSILSSTRHASHAGDFRGGDLAAFLGGCEVDLTGATIASPPAVIDVFTLWGGVEIIVPRGWHVVVKGVPILAGFEDKTLDPAEDDLLPGELRQELVVKGFAIMGSVEIKTGPGE